MWLESFNFLMARIKHQNSSNWIETTFECIYKCRIIEKGNLRNGRTCHRYGRQRAPNDIWRNGAPGVFIHLTDTFDFRTANASRQSSWFELTPVANRQRESSELVWWLLTVWETHDELQPVGSRQTKGDGLQRVPNAEEDFFGALHARGAPAGRHHRQRPGSPGTRLRLRLHRCSLRTQRRCLPPGLLHALRHLPERPHRQLGGHRSQEIQDRRRVSLHNLT